MLTCSPAFPPGGRQCTSSRRAASRDGCLGWGGSAAEHEDLRGRVVLLNFCVYSCGNCERTVPSLVAFDRAYRARGLTVIGIHTPEFSPSPGEHDRADVGKALARRGIEHPNAQHNDARTWQLYHIRYWSSPVPIGRKRVMRTGACGGSSVGDAEHEQWCGYAAQPFAD